jgi:hypothetical protein
LTFLTPAGALVVLVALFPLAWLLLAARRAEGAARTLGLAPSGRRSLVVPAVLAAVACVCAGLAAAQPVLRLPQRDAVRSRSEVLYVVDVSRSMAASSGPTGLTRLAQARAVVARLRAATADVPSGLGGMTDRVLPYLLPTPDRAVFDSTLRQSVLIESPPPREVSTNATTFDSLDSLAGNGWFDRSAQTRTCVLVTDGESRSFSPSGVADALNAARCSLVVVRVGGAGDRVYDAGVPEAGYTPDPAAASKIASLVEAAGGRSFDASDVGGATAALRRDAERGPVAHETERTTEHGLAPWFALVALLATVALVLTRFRPGVHMLRPTIAG